MNRVIIGFVVLLAFILSLVYIGRRFSTINLRGYLNRATPRPSVLMFPTPTSLVLPSPSPVLASPATVLPNSGVLPATGL